MEKNVTIHSFRRSVGKSSLTANLATQLALKGRRVGLVDTDFQSASAHLFFGIHDGDPGNTLNDYLQKKCDILDAVRDVTDRLGQDVPGKLFLVPASTQISDIMHMLRISMKLEDYTEALTRLQKELALDIIFVDTPAGLNENTLTCIAVANMLVLVLHPDQHDFQGTAVTVDVSRRLQVPGLRLVLNDTAETVNNEEIVDQLEKTYHCGGGVILQHAEELLALASSQPFVLCYPDHPLTARINELAQELIGK